MQVKEISFKIILSMLCIVMIYCVYSIICERTGGQVAVADYYQITECAKEFLYKLFRFMYIIVFILLSPLFVLIYKNLKENKHKV